MVKYLGKDSHREALMMMKERITQGEQHGFPQST